MFGADSVVTDTDFHAVHSVPRRYAREGIATEPVVIEDDVFVGMRAIILKGVRVGRGAVIGANSVVTQDVPENAIVAGSPARNVGWVGESSRGAEALRRCKRMGRP
jgi:acetyltransferase-like isoleucine patch superfamily enzyme